MSLKDHVFISRRNIQRLPLESFRQIKELGAIEIERGCWVRINSSAHTMAILLGYDFYDSAWDLLESGSYDRYGRIC